MREGVIQSRVRDKDKGTIREKEGMKRQRQRAERVTEKEELERQLYRVELEKRMGKQKVCKDR